MTACQFLRFVILSDRRESKDLQCPEYWPKKDHPKNNQRGHSTEEEATKSRPRAGEPRRASVEDYFALLRTIDVPEDFMAERPMNVIPDSAGIFDDMIDEPTEVAPRTKPAKSKSVRSRNPRKPTRPGAPGSRS